MALTTLSQIVPALRPRSNDIGDYALDLAIHLRDRYGIQSRFIVCDPEWDGPGRVEGFVVRRLRVRNEAGIWCLLAAAKDPHSAVLLHYAGDGYDKLGTPFWLSRGIKSWLMEHTHGPAGGEKQFCTMFHELWGSSTNPWKRQFYLHLLQKQIVAQLHRRSKVSVANTLHTQRLLDGIKPHKTIWIPMPSNLPAIGSAKPGRRRQRFRIAIFGQPSARCATMKVHAKLLRTLDEKNQLDSVTLLGDEEEARPGAPEADLIQKCISRARFQFLGRLSPTGVSLSLQRADLLLSHCRGEFACKSGSVMAALSASCPAVLRDGENAVPLKVGDHFLASDDSPQGVAQLEQSVAEGHLDRVGAAGHAWYERFADWKVVAPQVRAALLQAAFRPKPSAEAVEMTPDPVDTWKQLACPSVD